MAIRSSLMHSGLRILSWIPNIGHLDGRVTVQTHTPQFNAPGWLEVAFSRYSGKALWGLLSYLQ